MCKECDERNGTSFFKEKEEEKQKIEDKVEAEQEVSPETNATFTKLTPGPDGEKTDFIATPEGNLPDFT